MKRLGLIVNPIAGMGGRVGLKGTDGSVILQKAISLGAIPRSSKRAAIALNQLIPLKQNMVVVTFPGDMGERTAVECGFHHEVLLEDSIPRDHTSREDTLKAAKEIQRHNVDLLLFAGGDGTARDICESIGTELPALGIPAGVKIHSAVFACSPKESGEVARLYLEGGEIQKREAEVMDIDEELFRKGAVRAMLYGYLTIPYVRQRVQGLKAGSPDSEEAIQKALASYFVREIMKPDTIYFVGPGTTTRGIMMNLNLEYSLLGVDCICNGHLLGNDLTEYQILDLCKKYKELSLVVTPIGGQGFIFGRGNQQISPEVLHYFSKDQLIILSTPKKLLALEGMPLLIDSGGSDIDAKFSGYVRIISGQNEFIVYRIK